MPGGLGRGAGWMAQSEGLLTAHCLVAEAQNWAV